MTKTNNTLMHAVNEYARHGMEIIPVSSIADEQDLRSKLGLAASDFLVCGFMGAAEGISSEIQEITETFPQQVVEIAGKIGVSISLLSGGGSPAKNNGLMALWSKSAMASGKPSYYVISENMLPIEFLPQTSGKAICTPLLGMRTDGLVMLGDVFLVLPGGIGTMGELAVYFTNLTAYADFSRKKSIIIDPLITDPATGKTRRYWSALINILSDMLVCGMIRPNKMQVYNEQTLIYQPAHGLSAKSIADELCTITMSIRADAYNFNTQAGYKPVDQAALKQCITPLAKESRITNISQYADINLRSAIPEWGQTLLQFANRASGAASATRHVAPK
jgi:predicted Rossmann-fold nucleotide-binding protein